MTPAQRRKLLARSDLESDGGWTLIELAVAMAVTALALTLLIPVLTTVTNVASASNSLTNAAGQARNAQRQLTADIGSANSVNLCFPSTAYGLPAVDQTVPSLSCPSDGTQSGSILRVLSNVNGSCEWIQWTVNSATASSNASWLMQQSWPLNGPISPTPPLVPLAGPLVANVNAQPIFSWDPTGHVLTLQITLQGSIGNTPNAPHYAAPGSQSVFATASIPLVVSTQAAGQC